MFKIDGSTILLMRPLERPPICPVLFAVDHLVLTAGSKIVKNVVVSFVKVADREIQIMMNVILAIFVIFF